VRRGFTLLEVVIALLVMELAVLGAVGVLTLASRTLARAEHLERAAAAVEGVMDSLTAEPEPTDGGLVVAGATISWAVDATGELALVALGVAGDTLVSVAAVLPPEGAGP